MGSKIALPLLAALLLLAANAEFCQWQAPDGQKFDFSPLSKQLWTGFGNDSITLEPYSYFFTMCAVANYYDCVPNKAMLCTFVTTDPDYQAAIARWLPETDQPQWSYLEGQTGVRYTISNGDRCGPFNRTAQIDFICDPTMLGPQQFNVTDEQGFNLCRQTVKFPTRLACRS